MYMYAAGGDDVGCRVLHRHRHAGCTLLREIRLRRRRALRMVLIAPMLLPGDPDRHRAAAALRRRSGHERRRLRIGHILVTMPYVFLNVTATLGDINPDLEEAARGLGATQGNHVFRRRMSLPLMKTGRRERGDVHLHRLVNTFSISLLLKGVDTMTLQSSCLNTCSGTSTPPPLPSPLFSGSSSPPPWFCSPTDSSGSADPLIEANP